MKLDVTYDPEADILERQEVAPGVVLDFDKEGRVVAMQMLTASKVLAPGDWQVARGPGDASADAAE